MEKLSSKPNTVGLSPMKRFLSKAEQARTIAEFLAKPEGKEMSAADAKGLLTASIWDNNPVVFYEHTRQKKNPLEWN